MVVTTPSHEALPQDEGAWRTLVESLGLQVPEGWRVRLAEAKFDPAAWHRDEPDEAAITRPVWRYRFVVEPESAARASAEDLDALVRDAMRRRRQRRDLPATVERGLVVVYADPQVGKTGSGGGTRELVERVATRFDRLQDHISDLRRVGRMPNAAWWLDAGDCIENFEQVASQAFTNDLTITEQVRVHRRLTFEGLDRLAGLFPRVVAAGVGSNHARVRRGKDSLGPPSDDWGLEVLSQVADAYARNDEAYGHVSFAFPERWRDSLSLDIAGTVVGLAHGNQFTRPDRAIDWWRSQTFGDQPIASARILVTAHYHHWRTQQVGAGRLWVQAPTLDNGSDWYSSRSGEESQPGMLVFSVGPDGSWDDMRLL